MSVNKKDKNMKKPIIIFGLIGSVLIVGIIAGFYYYSKNKNQNINTITVGRQTLKDIIDISGSVEAENDVVVKSNTNGLVVKRFINENVKILDGSPIIEIAPQDPQLARLQINQAKINSSNSQMQAQTELNNALRALEDSKDKQQLNLKNFVNQIDKANSNIVFLEKEYLRNKNLYDQGAIQKQTIDNQIQQIEQTKIELKTIKDNYNKAKLERSEILNAENRINTAKTNLNNAIKQGQASIDIAEDSINSTIITAPFTGTITKWQVNKGDYLNPGSPIARLQTLDNIRLKLPLNELDLPKINTKNPVSILFDSYPDKSYRGKIVWISQSSTLENNVQVFPVEVIFDNKENLIKPGMSGDAQIIVSEKRNVLAIPLSAIQKKDNKIYVKVLVDNEITEKEIIPGMSTLDYLEVKSGLNQGDKIILEQEKKVK